MAVIAGKPERELSHFHRRSGVSHSIRDSENNPAQIQKMPGALPPEKKSQGVAVVFSQPSEEHPLPWRYVPLPFDGGGVSRLTYLLIAANDVEICCLSDQRAARFICAANTLKQEGRFRSGKLAHRNWHQTAREWPVWRHITRTASKPKSLQMQGDTFLS